MMKKLEQVCIQILFLVLGLADFSNITMKFVSIFICIKVIIFQDIHYQLNVHFKNLDLHFPI